MSKRYETNQLFKVHQSSLLVQFLWLTHMIAFAAVLLSSVVLFLQLAIILLITISLFFYLKRETQRADFFIRYSPAFGWEIAYQENHFHSFNVLPSTVLTPYLIVLHIKQQNRKKQTILICKDALKNNDFRKLRVEIKVSGIQKDVS